MLSWNTYKWQSLVSLMGHHIPLSMFMVVNGSCLFVLGTFAQHLIHDHTRITSSTLCCPARLWCDGGIYLVCCGVCHGDYPLESWPETELIYGNGDARSLMGSSAGGIFTDTVFSSSVSFFLLELWYAWTPLSTCGMKPGRICFTWLRQYQYSRSSGPADGRGRFPNY